MSRFSLDRAATRGERVFGAGLVLVLAFFLGLASYKLWRLALTTSWLDPFILFLAVISALGSLLLVRSLSRHLAAPPRKVTSKAVFVVACVMVATGAATLAFAWYYGLNEPRLYGPALVSVAVGLIGIRKAGRP